jgi:hypothetical protein
MATENEIAAKCSPALSGALSSSPSESREVQVMLRRDLSPSQRAAALRELEDAAGATAHVTFDIASIEMPLASVGRVARLDSVEWLDLASTASLDELLD